MKMTYIVHGFVQGVGYRSFVKGVAERFGVRGIVKNADDGSVIIVAEGEEASLERFGDGISISMKYGVQVMDIERRDGNLLPEYGDEFNEFRIVK